MYSNYFRETHDLYLFQLAIFSNRFGREVDILSTVE